MCVGSVQTVFQLQKAMSIYHNHHKVYTHHTKNQVWLFPRTKSSYSEDKIYLLPLKPALHIQNAEHTMLRI